MKEQEIRYISEYFKALSHPTRLMIVQRLLGGRKCVSSIEKLLGLKQANVSQHLNILRMYGIVDYCTEGQSRCYYLKDSDKMEKMFYFVDVKGRRKR